MFSSTAAVYGVPDATPIPEDAPLRPINPYGETKRTFEGALALVRRGPTACGACRLRYFNVAGATERARRGPRPRDAPDPERPPARPRAAEPLTVFGDDYPTPDGTCIRDYIHVADLADAHLRAPSRRPRPATRGPTSRSSATSATAAGSASARSSPPPSASSAGRSRTTVGPRRAGDPPVLVAAADRAPSVLGWRAAPPDARGDGRLGVGLAAGATRTATPD